MSKTWKKFEKDSAEYIQKLLIEYNDVNTVLSGGSNSNEPDVKILKNNNEIFNIEVKKSESQGGQFAIEYENEKFVFSKKNKTNSTSCQPIIDYMNNNISLYKNITTASTSVKCSYQLLISRLIDHYKNEMNTKYIISKDKNNYVVFKIEDIGLFFEIKGIVRRKKSGTRSIGVKMSNEILQFVKNSDISVLAGSCYTNKRLYINSDKDLKGIKMNYLDKYNLIFSERTPVCPNGNELRITSSTKNPNFLCVLSLKAKHPATQEAEMLSLIENYPNT